MEKKKELIRLMSKLLMLRVRLTVGFNEVIHTRIPKVVLAIYAALCIVGIAKQKVASYEYDWLKPNLGASILFAILGALFIIYLCGFKFRLGNLTMELAETSLVNSVGESRLLINCKKLNDREMEMEFYSAGVTLAEWEKKTSEVENALNITIAKIKLGENRQRIIIHCVPYADAIPKFVQFSEVIIPQEEPVFALGEGVLGQITINLSKIPHLLIGGSTGSGKTVLLKMLLYQAHCKGAVVCIADFKGGIDYNQNWRSRFLFATDKEHTISLLDSIIREMGVRKEALTKNGCRNVDEHNKMSREKIHRIIFACDEVAAMLDKTGLNKEEKELVAQIEKRLNLIAQQGRAFNINLLLALQRPDAQVLNGSIKNNLDYRICGRADDVLSQIILDNTTASDKIPKYEEGLFLNNIDGGELFRAYYFDDEGRWNG